VPGTTFDDVGPPFRPCGGEASGGVGGGAEPELARDRLQSRDHVRDVLVELQTEQLSAGVDLVAVHAGREGRLLELLPDRLRLQTLEAGRPH